MAENPRGTHAPPYCYRILVPTMARAVPLPPTKSFRVLTILFAWGAGVLIYYMLRSMGHGRFFSVMGIVLFHSLNFGTKFVLFDFWLADPALFFFSALAMLCMMRGATAGLTTALCLAVLSKESALFLLPLVYSMRAKRIFDRRALAYAAAVSIAPLAICVLLRVFVPASGPYSPLALLRQFGTGRMSSDLAALVRGGTLGTWGILALLLFLLGLRNRVDFALRGLPFLVLVYAQPLFAANVDRLLVYGFPVVIPIAAAGLERLALAARLGPWMTAGTALIPFVLIAVKSGYQPPSPEQQLLVLAVWAAFIVLVKRIRKKRIA
jgi:hypothetical protein